MDFTCQYDSPLGRMVVASDEEALTGMWFEGQRYFARGLAAVNTARKTKAIAAGIRWLDAYFAGKRPVETPPVHFRGTPFQIEVWELLRTIPCGTTTTYGALARRMADRRGAGKVSARAVGAAVGRNPVSLLVPCHRVVGSDGRLVGYAGGVGRKEFLLALERQTAGGGVGEFL